MSFSQGGAHAAPLASPQRRHKPLFVTGLSALYGVCSALTQCDEILRPLPSFLRKEGLVFHHGLPHPGKFPRTPQQNAPRFALQPGDCSAWHGIPVFFTVSPRLFARECETDNAERADSPIRQSKTHSQIYCTIAAGALNNPLFSEISTKKRLPNECEFIWQ